MRETSTPIEAVWRIESPRLIAALTRMLHGDVSLAEDFAQDALVAALEAWPKSGVPDKPGAWLMATAKRRAIDQLRRRPMLDEKHGELGRTLDEEREAVVDDLHDAIDDPIGDDLLRLVFIACHPVLPQESRVALTLRLLGGLTTDEIARAFLVPSPTVGQRISRAKKTLAEANVPYEVPRGEALRERLEAVLEVVYLVFNEGYTATAGSDWIRPELCHEAIRLGRVLAALAPDEPEVHGLLALMELQASRLRARTAADGAPVLLLDQDRARWDGLLIAHGLAALERARALGGPPGFYQLQAEIAACHARARTPDATDWKRIADLYGSLARLTRSAIVELNRAVAVSMADGPAAALRLVDALAEEPALRGYHLLPSVRGDLLERLERHEEARAEFEKAAALTSNEREKALLLARARG
ncbi:MAG TPA: RNA polymerase sigma factor [Longimicrobiales bacterium]